MECECGMGTPVVRGGGAELRDGDDSMEAQQEDQRAHPTTVSEPRKTVLKERGPWLAILP